jgi:hypothetical protein
VRRIFGHSLGREENMTENSAFKGSQKKTLPQLHLAKVTAASMGKKLSVKTHSTFLQIHVL